MVSPSRVCPVRLNCADDEGKRFAHIAALDPLSAVPYRPTKGDCAAMALLAELALACCILATDRDRMGRAGWLAQMPPPALGCYLS
ncbi:hypothetical protein CKO40_02950 [Halochromatium glycolicum]|uniref:Uncharacterized protein n=1 Tax=Halochromatium glycolicum TaxID=85075 RepID=A0AAJ0U1I6_9GAMM|nr:hypothetical protein [Halochromatium glycolicum]